MKTLKHLFTALLLLCATMATAHDFEVGGIYYDITNATNKTVAVTHRGDSYSSYSNEYTGSVVIPESVTYNSTTYSVTSISYSAFYNCSGLISVVIPNSVTSIGDCAFRFCTNLTSIEIPNSVTSIGGYAFEGCTGLASVEIGNSVTFIGPLAFCDCSALTSIVIPNSVTSIGEYAFGGCTGLTSIVICNSITSIDSFAFSNCSGLKTVINFSNLTFSKGSSNNGYVAYNADKVNNAPNGSIEGDYVFGKPNGVNTLVGYLGNETELTFPNDYKGEDYKIGSAAFAGCSSLTSIVIPNSVKSIGEGAFKNCSNIETLYIGNSIESIGDEAFAGCEKINEIKIGLEEPISGSKDIFADAVYDDAILYVPIGAKYRYEKREPWNLFFDIVEMDFTGIDNVKAEPTVDASQNGKVKTVYDLSGRAVDNPTNGVYIINGKKVLVK